MTLTERQRDVPAAKPRSAPDVVAPTNRVNVALPFSHLHVSESSTDLAELAAIVADLASVVEGALPGTNLKKLRERAQALRARVQ